MTDLTRLVAEELLGITDYTRLKDGDIGWTDDLVRSHLQSWHGIGLVVEAVEKRDYWLELLQGSDPPWYASFYTGGMTKGDAQSDKPWLAVFEAARKAVEGK